MTAEINVKNGHVEGGSPRERLVLKLLWLISWCFVPLNFRGFWRVARILCTILGVKERQWVTLANGLKFSIDLRDPYWNRLISPQFHYEPELHHLLKKLAGEDYVFLDCGANMGYWSCHLASNLHGNKSVYSIEPLSSNFSLLKSHLERNSLQATLYHHAVSDKADESVTLYKPGGHASVSLIGDAAADNMPSETIKTLTLDSLLADLPSDTQNIFIKLDVEGVEIRALKGAKELLKRNPLIFYEDHGNEPESPISRYVLEELGYRIIHITDDGEWLPMDSIDVINMLKTDAMKGYNFLAFSEECRFKEKLIP